MSSVCIWGGAVVSPVIQVDSGVSCVCDVSGVKNMKWSKGIGKSAKEEKEQKEVGRRKSHC